MKTILPVGEKPRGGGRYVLCARCRRWWNVSAKLVLPHGGYFCPQCSGRRQRS